MIEARPPLFVGLMATPPSGEISLLQVRAAARMSDANEAISASVARTAPVVLSVSLNDQTIDVYRGTDLIESSKVSSGMQGHETRPGVFSILDKERFHHSNIYSGAPMPWMQRLTRSGTALHAGVVPGYPASHGCLRLPFSFAVKLFQMTEIGENVIIANEKLAPKLIEHPNLFQPLSTWVHLASAQGENRASDTAEASPGYVALPVVVARGLDVEMLSSELTLANTTSRRFEEKAYEFRSLAHLGDAPDCSRPADRCAAPPFINGLSRAAKFRWHLRQRDESSDQNVSARKRIA